jgi:hypothetical protein
MTSIAIKLPRAKSRPTFFSTYGNVIRQHKDIFNNLMKIAR